ncbi:MAG TPA: toll/interleukin-1 receptor domain-containing protein [Symbiobacteriaceae bacterium]|nr:toll/interleukin-1 receptor domain-containing protein [Symbiobacteriaceae bacterium]
MGSYRVFISYSHKDLELVQRVVNALEENGLTPIWDRNFAFGYGFHEQIQTFISHAHVFMPVITRGSSKRGWVHQEIGYATALNIPVLPATHDALPGEMIQRIHALHLSEDPAELRQQLSLDVFDNLVNRYREPSFALFQSADLAEERAMMMVRYATDVLDLGAFGCVRQKGGLSSFHIPDQVITDPIWKLRYGTGPRSEFHCRCQRNERITLEKHARTAGCRLIINPAISEQFDRTSQLVRLQTLAKFLAAYPDEKVQVAITQGMPQQYSLTIVGDWFAAESASASLTQGYRQTIFTRHAPSMRSRIDLFESEFQELLAASRWDEATSRSSALELIQANIERLHTMPG